jgi:hypothetical protein
MISFKQHNSLGYYFFHTLPRVIIRDLIFREMLDLGDIARLEVAAAVHRLHQEDQVSEDSRTGMMTILPCESCHDML